MKALKNSVLKSVQKPRLNIVSEVNVIQKEIIYDLPRRVNSFTNADNL